MKQKSSIKIKTANFFGTLGYLLCFLQWLWAVMLYFSVVQSLVVLTTPTVEKTSAQAPAFDATVPTPLLWAVVIVVTAAMVAVTIYAFMKVPASLAKTGNKAVYKTAENIAPVIIKAQHKKVTPQSRSRVTSRVILAIKLLLIIVPLALSMGSGLLEKQYIEYSIAVMLGCGLAVCSLAAFAVQYGACYLLRLRPQDLW